MSVSYWMNRLQGLPGSQPFIVSLNPLTAPRAETVWREMEYDHPVFDQHAMAAQRQLPQIQGRNRIWYCGSYCGYGFHEDALRSAVSVAAEFGVTAPWARDDAKAAHGSAQLHPLTA